MTFKSKKIVLLALFSGLLFSMYPSLTLAMTCTGVTTYSIGTIDSRFLLTRDELKQDLSQAEQVWEIPLKRNQFAFQEKGGDITINLVYDTRQETSLKLAATNNKLTAINTGFDALTTQFNILASTTKDEQAKNAQDFILYKSHEDAYNSAVNAANSRGGATESEYTQLQAQQELLRTEFSSIKATENQLNLKVASLNTLSNLFKQLATVLNNFVANYNKTVASVGQFEEGVYKEVGSVRSILIYEYSNQNQLTRVLAHEMGHALGLDHVVDSSAIMYKVNKATNLSATDADVRELSRVCTL